MDIPMVPKLFAVQVALLLFLISFLANLLQRRYSKARLDRLLSKQESILNFLRGAHKSLGKLERNLTLEMHGVTSPQELGKAIHAVRNEIQSTLTDVEEHLRSFREYRRKEKPDPRGFGRAGGTWGKLVGRS